MQTLHDSGQTPDDSSDRRGVSTKHVLLGLLIVTVGGAAVWFGTLIYIANEPEKCFERGLIAYREGDIDTVAREAARLDGNEEYAAHASLLTGMVRLNQGSVMAAIEDFEAATEHPDTKVEAYIQIGTAYYETKRYRRALETFHLAEELDQERVDIKRWLSATYYDLGIMTRSLDYLDLVIEKVPDDPKPHRLKAVIFRDYERWTEAVAEYEKTIELMNLDLPDPEIRLQYAECLVSLKKYEEALKALEGVTSVSDVLAVRGLCRFALGDFELATSLTNEALEMSPGNGLATIVKARLLAEDGRMDQAIALLNQAAKADPFDYEVHQYLSEVYRKKGEIEEADRELEEMQRILGLRKEFAKLHEAALADLEDAELRNKLAMNAINLGRLDLARTWYEAALGLDPANKTANEGMQELDRREKELREPANAPVQGSDGADVTE